MISFCETYKKNYWILVVLSSLFFHQLAYGSNNVASARAVGLGAGYIALARGIEAPQWNPANLGLKDNPKFSVNVLSMGIRFGNSSFNRMDYNRYIGTMLESSDIKTILKKIPETGLKVNSRSDINLINVSYKNIAFASATEINIAGTIAKDYLDLILNGNKLMRQYQFETTQAASYVMLTNIISVGIPLRLEYFNQFSVGMNIKHFKGFAFASLNNEKGSLTTTANGIHADGQVIARYSKGGSGWGADIGAVAEFKSGMTLGIAIINFLGRTHWTKDVREESAYYFAHSVTVESANQDSLYQVDNYSKKIGSIRYHQPKYLRIGLSHKWQKWLFSSDLCLTWRQFKYITPAPKFHLGAEYPPKSWLLFRCGLALGGARKIAPAIGCGIRKKKMALDIGFAYQRALLPFFARGATLALAYYFFF